MKFVTLVFVLSQALEEVILVLPNFILSASGFVFLYFSAIGRTKFKIAEKMVIISVIWSKRKCVLESNSIPVFFVGLARGNDRK